MRYVKTITAVQQAIEDWRLGVRTRMLVSACNGSVQLCVFEQWIDPEAGAPIHFHDVEEILTVLAGKAELWVGEDRTNLDAGQSIIVPAGQKHGFKNTGSQVLHMQAILASAVFEAHTDGANTPVRRWDSDNTSLT